MLTVFKETKSALNYFKTCIIANLKNAFANKKSAFIQTLFMFLNNLMWLAFWYILFYNSDDGNINGTTLNDILYLWSIPTISFGLCFFLFGGVEELSYKIANKDIDILLTKPKHSLISLITSSSKMSALGDLIYGLFIGIFAVNFDIPKYIGSILIAILGAIGFLGLCIIVHSLSFFFGDMSKTARTYTITLLITFTIYPENMFKGILKVAMYTVIPAMYIAHWPIAIVKDFNLSLLLLEILAIAIIMVLALFTYEKGLKRYGK